MRVVVLTAVAMVCFAANSLLCRAALRGTAIDPALFTAIRLASGSGILVMLCAMRGSSIRSHGTWSSALALVTYAVAFSFAYVRVPAATGALLLFGAVQLTMVIGGLLRGERPSARQVVGWLISIGGMVVLTAPGLAPPPLSSAAMMAIAGAAWGMYSLRGRGVTEPTAATASNFVRSLPVAALLVVAALATSTQYITRDGVLLAMASGAVASGLGYAIWYAAVPALGATRAAAVQLSVPMITALGAFAVLAEPLGVVHAIGGGAIIGGLALALRVRAPR